MSTLDFYTPASDGSELAPVSDDVQASSTPEEIYDAAKLTGSYQTSEGASNLAEATGKKILERATPENKAELEKRIAEYKKGLTKHAPRANVDPNVGRAARALDYAEMYKSILDDTSPLPYATFQAEMETEIKRATYAQQDATANTIASSPTLESLKGGFVAGMSDPRELKYMAGSALAGALSGGTTVGFQVSLFAADVVGGMLVTASYQKEVLDLYKDLNHEEGYTGADAALAVATAGVLPLAIAGGGRAVGLTVEGAVKAVNKVAAQRNKFVERGLPTDVTNEFMGPLQPIDEAASTRAINGDVPEGSQETSLELDGKIADGMDDAEEGRLNGEPGPKAIDEARPLEIAETSGGVIDPGTPIDIAATLDGKPFNDAEVKAAVIQGIKPEILQDLELDLETTPNAKDAYVLRTQITALEDRNIVPKAYKPLVDAGVDLARKEHKARATTPTPDEQIAQTNKLFEDMGAVPDTKPSTLAPVKAIDPDMPAPYKSNAEIDESVTIAQADDPGKVTFHEDEDGNVTTGTIGADLDQRAKLLELDKIIGACT